MIGQFVPGRRKRTFILWSKQRNMNFDRRSVVSAIALGAAVILTSLPGGSQELTKLTIATTPIDIGAQPFYAQDQGFFKAAGIDANIQIISNGGAITAAVVGGSVDIAQSNVVSLAAAHEKGLDLVVIAPAGAYSSKEATTECVVAKNSPYKTAKDLNGKVFAGNGLKNITQIGAFAWMTKNGGDTSTAKFVEMPFPQMAPALTAGRIDMAVLAEPDLSAELAAGTIRSIGNCYDGIAKNFLIGAWFTTAAWAKAHPDRSETLPASDDQDVGVGEQESSRVGCDSHEVHEDRRGAEHEAFALRHEARRHAAADRCVGQIRRAHEGHVPRKRTHRARSGKPGYVSC